jgi:arylsulfatase A-like enzyme
MRKVQLLFTAVAFLAGGLGLFAAGQASHVVLVVWDGMRPDFVTPENTPTLYRLSQDGVTFKNHHPVFVSSTEVNGTALATGAYPQSSGVIGNYEFRPAINPTNKFMTADLDAVRKGDELTHHHYLGYATVAEMVRASGRRTAVAGAKPVALLADRSERGNDACCGCMFAGEALPENLQQTLTNRLGKFPSSAKPNVKRDRWATDSLIDVQWENGVPAFSLLWLSEPDASQHATGPGSATSLAAIRSSDDNLARVLAALKAKGVEKDTDVIVVSDHAFSTISAKIDVAGALNTNGFNAYYKVPAGGASRGDIFVIANGGATFFYVREHDRNVVERAVRWLQQQSFSGVILTRKAMRGTFTLEQGKVDSSDAPDIVLSMRWADEKSTNGTPGLLCSSSEDYGVGQGMHGSFSPYDVHNTCVAAGPDFRAGFADDLPTGNIDIAPTILWLLKVKPARKLDGRVVYEALVGSEDTRVPAPRARHIEAESSQAGQRWRQYLDWVEMGKTIYFLRGNGGGEVGHQ